jgi:hypothetical protein
MKSIARKFMLFCLFGGWFCPKTAGAIAGPVPTLAEKVQLNESITGENNSTCLRRLAGPREAQPLVLAAPTQPDNATPLPLDKKASPPPSSPNVSSGYFDSLESLNRFIDDNGMAQWVKNARIEGDVETSVSPHFVDLISDYRNSVNDILLQKNLDQGQILKILYYNISSFSSGLIPIEWSRRSSELNYFLTDQLELLGDFLGKEIVFNYETIAGRVPKIVVNRFGLFPSPTRNISFKYETVEKIPRRVLSMAMDFVNNFESIISPLLHPRFGVRIVFHTCHLLYDLMLEQKYFQVSKKKIDLSLHRLLQDTLLRKGTHPFVLLYFWAKEPRLLMDQDFPTDGFWFRRSGVFKNLPQSRGRLKSLTDSALSSRWERSNIFHWGKYDTFDPNLVLIFGSAAKYEVNQPPVGPQENLLEYLKNKFEHDSADTFSRALGTSRAYFNLQLESTGPWSSTLSSHASALSLFLLSSANHERLLQFDLQISKSISADDIEFYYYLLTSRNGYLDRRERKDPSLARKLMHRFSEYFTRISSSVILGSVDSQKVEPLLLENDRAHADASIALYKTPALPDLGAVIDMDTSTPDDDISQIEVQKLGTTYKQLAQEIEWIYGWVMNVEFGIGNLIGYSRSWPEITSMINPDHLGEMINRLSYDLDVLVDIQNRMFNFNEDTQADEALAVKRINRTFAHSNVFNLIQFTKSLLENLEIIQHAMKVHHPSKLVPANPDNLTILEEMSKVSQHLRGLPSLLQRPSASPR